MPRPVAWNNCYFYHVEKGVESIATVQLLREGTKPKLGQARGPSMAAIIGIADHRAVSMLVTQSMEWIARWSWKTKDPREQPVQVTDTSGRRGCNFLWVLPKHRGMGLAKKMTDAAIALSPHTKEDFPWAPPFSVLGERFLRRYCPDTFTVGR